MATNTPKFALPLLEEGVAQERLLHNQAISVLDIIVGGAVKRKDLLNPVALSPAEGDSYIIDGVGAGDWSGKDDNIAYFLNGQWNFIAPVKGMTFAVDDLPIEDKIEYDGSGWVPFSIPEPVSELIPYTESGNSQSISNTVTSSSITHTFANLPSGDNIVYGWFDLELLHTGAQDKLVTITINGKVTGLFMDSAEDINSEKRNGGGISAEVQNGDTIAILANAGSGGGTARGDFEIWASQKVTT